MLDGASILCQYISDLTFIAFAFYFYIIGCLSLRNDTQNVDLKMPLNLFYGLFRIL